MKSNTVGQTILLTLPQQNMFTNLANYQKCLVFLQNDKIVFDTLDEKMSFAIDAINSVEFVKTNGTFIVNIDTNRGLFVGTETYKEFKDKDSIELFKFLRDKFINPKLYDKLISSTSKMMFRLFGKDKKRKE